MATKTKSLAEARLKNGWLGATQVGAGHTSQLQDAAERLDSLRTKEGTVSCSGAAV